MPQPSVPTHYRLANQILDVVRDGRFDRGLHLTEHWLSTLLGVSRTPIRASLKLLADQGVVKKRKNHGYFLLKPFDALQRAGLAVPSSTEQKLYQQLVRDRLAGRLSESITQSAIAERYSVDRTLLLRVLARLAEDSLIARNKGHGWRFLPTLDTAQALRSSYEFRLTIEPAGLLLNSFRLDAAVIERCRLQHKFLISHPKINSVDRSWLFETDVAFHELLAGATGNAYFLQAVQQQNRLRRLLEFWTYANKRRVRDWCREHLAIMDAITANNYQRAAEAMRQHLMRAYGATAQNPPTHGNVFGDRGSSRRR